MSIVGHEYYNSHAKAGRSIHGFSYGINNCFVDDSGIKTLLHEACEKTPFYGYKKITKILRMNHGLHIIREATN